MLSKKLRQKDRDGTFVKWEILPGSPGRPVEYFPCCFSKDLTGRLMQPFGLHQSLTCALARMEISGLAVKTPEGPLRGINVRVFPAWK